MSVTQSVNLSVNHSIILKSVSPVGRTVGQSVVHSGGTMALGGSAGLSVSRSVSRAVRWHSAVRLDSRSDGQLISRSVEFIQSLLRPLVVLYLPRLEFCCICG